MATHVSFCTQGTGAGDMLGARPDLAEAPLYGAYHAQDGGHCGQVCPSQGLTAPQGAPRMLPGIL